MNLLCRVLLLPAFFLVGCQQEPGTRKSDQDRSVDLNQPVHYVLAGQHFAVPLGYHYGAFIKRRGRWPQPRPLPTEAGAISITGVLPGMQPYSVETKERFEQRGHGNKVHVLIEANIHPYPMDELIRRMSGRWSPLPSNLAGLRHYFDSVHGMASDEQGEDVYIKDSKEFYFMIRCPRMPAPSPGCHATKIDRNGLYIEYDFGKSHLASWQQIDQNIETLVSRLRSNESPSRPHT